MRKKMLTNINQDNVAEAIKLLIDHVRGPVEDGIPVFAIEWSLEESLTDEEYEQQIKDLNNL